MNREPDNTDEDEILEVTITADTSEFDKNFETARGGFFPYPEKKPDGK